MPMPLVVAGSNARLKPPKDWNEEKFGCCADLHVRQVVEESGLFYHETAWEFTDSDIEALRAGGRLILRVAGFQPPVSLRVEPPTADDTQLDLGPL
jgi:hypothetical protein